MKQQSPFWAILSKQSHFLLLIVSRNWPRGGKTSSALCLDRDVTAPLRGHLTSNYSSVPPLQNDAHHPNKTARCRLHKRAEIETVLEPKPSGLFNNAVSIAEVIQRISDHVWLAGKELEGAGQKLNTFAPAPKTNTDLPPLLQYTA